MVGNSSYEEWRTENPSVDYHEFVVHLDKMSKSGALFDLVKLNDVSKDVIARMPASEVYEKYTAWAKEYDKEMYELVTSNEAMAREIFNIDKEGPKPRKDFAKWDEVKDKIFYFFDELFYNETAEQVELPKTLSLENAKAVIEVKSSPGITNSDQSRMPALMKAVEDAKVVIKNGSNTILYYEGTGKVFINGEEHDVKVHYQSGLSGILVDELLEKGTCRLATYAESSYYHKTYLSTIAPFINKIKGWTSDACPIT